MKKIFKSVLTGLFCLILLLNFTAPVFAAINIVKPNADFYVLDNADVLSYETEGHIVLNNDTLYDACGAQIVFVTLDTMGSTNIKDYAYELFDTWGIGSAEKNNGILILMAIRDDDYAYILGRGIEAQLSVSQLSEIVDQYLEPDFAKKDYNAGALKLFDALFETVANIYEADVSVKDYSTAILSQPEIEAIEIMESEIETIEITPEDLFDAYQANMLAAEKKYKGKTLILKGEVGDIGRGLFGGLYITLKVSSNNTSNGIQCNFNESYIDALAELNKGDIVEVTGTCSSMSVMLQLNNCSFEGRSLRGSVD